MAVERSDAKHTTLPIEKYDGKARMGELVADINNNPFRPSLYIANVDQKLNFFAQPDGGLDPAGSALGPNFGPNSTLTGRLILGDIKQSLLTVDHVGWVKLDGRAISTLTASQQAAAVALGYSINLPNVTGRIMKQTAAATGTTGGGNQVTLTDTNIPYMVGSFFTFNMYGKEVVAVVDDPIFSPPNLVANEPRGPVLVDIHGVISIGQSNPEPLNIPDEPFMAMNTFVFLGP